MPDRDNSIKDCVEKAKKAIEEKEVQDSTDYCVYGLLNMILSKMTVSKWQNHVPSFIGFVSSDAKDDDEIWYCPLCSHGNKGFNAFAYNYCPQCGAKMERGDRNA